MAKATDNQMQKFMDERMRVRAEQVRALLLSMRDDKNSIDDIYERAANGPVWNDNRTDVPHASTQNDVLAMNSFMSAMLDFANNSPDFQAILRLCVRPVNP